MNSLNLVLLAAGRARRFGGIKPLAPVGPNGEAVIDLGISDALFAGFTNIVVVLNPQTGPEIQEHIESVWSKTIDVAFALQPEPRGTLDAVTAAQSALDTKLAFGVINADDLYGVDALKMAATTLRNYDSNMLVGFGLDRALVGSEPVTRGVCQIQDGELQSIVERRNVVNHGGIFESSDDLEPRELPPDSVVSMNLWGFQAATWAAMNAVMDQFHDASEHNEVLLPEFVARLIGGEFDTQSPGLSTFLVATSLASCIGVTHPGDLGLVQEEIRGQIERSERSAVLFQHKAP